MNYCRQVGRQSCIVGAISDVAVMLVAARDASIELCVGRK